MDQEHYPETLGKIYIVNAPRIFAALWASVALFLSPEVRPLVRPLARLRLCVT